MENIILRHKIDEARDGEVVVKLNGEPYESVTVYGADKKRAFDVLSNWGKSIDENRINWQQAVESYASLLTDEMDV